MYMVSTLTPAWALIVSTKPTASPAVGSSGTCGDTLHTHRSGPVHTVQATLYAKRDRASDSSMPGQYRTHGSEFPTGMVKHEYDDKHTAK